jgi:predicted alpha/beta superfamily hydrolase
MNRLLILSFLFFANGVTAQQRAGHVIPSKAFGSDRKITVHLPPSYAEDSTRAFPVAYLFDGQFEPYLAMVSGMMDYYSQTNDGVEMIIVAVHTDDRFEEFVPEAKTDPDDRKTYSTRLTESLEEEVFPFVSSHYRTTDFKLGIGHSLGGTFLLYEAFRDHSPFAAIIAASPNTTVNDMTKMIPQYLDQAPEMTTFLYITGGDTDLMEEAFLNSTMQIDSAISARKAVYPDWNFQQYVHANHMETFPQTFNDGYLLFSQKWNLSERDLDAFKGLKGQLLEQEIVNCFHRKSITRKKEVPYSFKNLSTLQWIAAQAYDFETAFAISDLTLRLLETDSTLAKDKEVLLAELQNKRDYYHFKIIASGAVQASFRKEYAFAAQEFLRAFDLNVLRGTYIERIQSLGALAQTGNIEEAFKQIELLANFFELQGNGSLTGNPLLTPLHKDKRWNKYMKILEENAKKAMQ